MGDDKSFETEIVSAVEGLITRFRSERQQRFLRPAPLHMRSPLHMKRTGASAKKPHKRKETSFAANQTSRDAII